ncbi:hypothetical protein LSUE1_G001183 [Lachnellula suecica]|uniref:NAD(P)-binding domain-containing protein n=1 Tax=Lachnellula suecica TaxID=602035 RepID=A0A8T9CCF8_9HELO|nr:hypothetical protein LSUE1_G001183 [Lachnellula suecica]
MAPIKDIAFFGATGGCAGACLARCLEAGYNCTALVRTPEKLTTLLADHGVSPETISSNLTMITGNIKVPADIAQTILPTTEILVSGIGSVPVWNKGALMPSIQDPTLCQVGMSTLLQVLRARKSAVKPLLVVVSTTGISKFGRDYPLAVLPIYKWMLHTPHLDKKAMEDMVIEAVRTEEGKDAVIGEYAILRPSLLTGGTVSGKVRAEVEDGKVASNAMGYSISRRDVGGYMFEEVIEKHSGPSGSGRIISVTY